MNMQKHECDNSFPNLSSIPQPFSWKKSVALANHLAALQMMEVVKILRTRKRAYSKAEIDM